MKITPDYQTISHCPVCGATASGKTTIDKIKHKKGCKAVPGKKK